MIMLLLTLALLGLIAWAITAFIPMPEAMKTVIIGAAVVVGVLYVMRALGITDIPVPRIR